MISITNNSFWNLISGNNTANRNNGDVSIKTGNIDFTSDIENGPIASSSVSDYCCEDPKDQEVPSPTPPAPPSQQDEAKGTSPASGTGNPGGGSSGGSGGSGNGGPALVAIGKILPATGSSWFFFATVANIVMLFLGMVLRLRSGRSPDFVRFAFQ